MIVKVKTRKTPSFRQLLNYILKHNEQNENLHFTLKHNLKGETVDAWVKQYEKNEHCRQRKRTDSVYLSHEILSFHKTDSKNITAEKLEEITVTGK